MQNFLQVANLVTRLCSFARKHKHKKDRWPKNKNSVIIYSPSSCSKPVWISFFC